MLLAGSVASAAAFLCSPMLSQASSKAEVAQAEVAQPDALDGEALEATKPKKPRRSQAKPGPSKSTAPKASSAKPEPAETAASKPDTAKPGAPVLVPPTTLAATAAAGANMAMLNVSAKLMQNGAGACASTIDAGAAPSMVGVTESNTVSLWSNVEPRDKHAASVFIGQRYGSNPAVPYGVTGLISSSTPSGSCDITVVQVVSSPLPCAKVRETLASGGKMLGELAGLALMQSADSQTLLMPTATNTCVLVGFNAKFGD